MDYLLALMKSLWIGLLVMVPLCAFAKVKVATFHPLLTDLVKQVGGNKVEVVNLVSSKTDVHSFDPTLADLQRAKGSKVYFACGKNLEPYLGKVRQMVGGAEVVEVGRKITSIKVSKGSEVYTCCPGHSQGSIDPHWWQGLSNWKRAASAVTDALAKVDPANKKYYEQNEKVVKRKFDILNSWVKKQLVQIPRSKRQLATAHAAYGYFCKEYGFKSIPVQGLNREQSTDMNYLATVVANIKKYKVAAVFPEYGNNDKGLKTVAKSAGVKLADPLYADTADSIEQLFRNNVNSIVKALK